MAMLHNQRVIGIWFVKNLMDSPAQTVESQDSWEPHPNADRQMPYMCFLNYPLVNYKIAIENGPVEIVDLPMKIAWWIFPVRYVNIRKRLPGRVTVI